MIAIKMVGHTNPSAGAAEDALVAASHLPGYIFGYVDPKENRVISFHEDAHPTSKLVKGQQRVCIS